MSGLGDKTDLDDVVGGLTDVETAVQQLEPVIFDAETQITLRLDEIAKKLDTIIELLKQRPMVIIVNKDIPLEEFADQMAELLRRA